MMYPLVREFADDGIPVTVSCRVYGLARAPYYRWVQNPFTDAQLDEAWLANAIFEYLEIFHNRQRRHSSLGMLSPIEYELRHANNLARDQAS